MNILTTKKKQFSIFEALDKATTLQEIRKVLKRYKLSETEINRLNSSCLDGLLVSAKYKKPLQKLIKSFPQYTETCKYYLEKGISKRCLIMASGYGREKIVELLLDRGADIHAKNDEALIIASRPYTYYGYAALSHPKTVKLLLDRGADIHTDNDKALRRAVDIETVKLLLERGANAGIDENITLRWASIHGYIEIVKMVLDRGVDIHTMQDRALYNACDNGYIEIVKLLLDRGADAYNELAFYSASERDYTEIVNLIIEKRNGIKNFSPY